MAPAGADVEQPGTRWRVQQVEQGDRERVEERDHVS